MATPIDERLVTEAARELRGAHGLPFTERQLWYAVCARLERPQVTEGAAQVAAGVVLLLLGIFLGIFVSVILSMVVPVAMVIIALGVQRRRFEHHRPTTRPLAVSFDGFVRETLAPLRAARRRALDGLLVTDDAETRLAPAGDGDAPEALVVCDRGETALLLASLARSASLPVGVVDEQACERLSAGRRVIAVHDADPRGAALPLRLARAGVGDVVDAGLRPSQLATRRVAVIEGAPVVLGADLAGLLTPDEVVWLAEGRRVELATLPPQQLVDGLRRVLAAEPVVAAVPRPAAGVRLASASLLDGEAAAGEDPPADD